ncbi:MAG: citrate transporter [Oscillospiraceae bacterium]|nr:citrate transporter [Oscillospiraceae bacterium]
MADKKKSGSITMIHSLIGIAIMLLFRFLPISLPQVTPTGMEVLGIFLGTLYLWTTVDPMWSSILCIAAIGLSSYAPMAGVLATAFGNPVVVQVLFMMILTGALVEEKVTLYIGRWILTRKIAEGRPWVFTFAVCVGCYVMSIVMAAPMGPILLFWPIMYGVFQQLGISRDEKYAKLSIILVVLASLYGFPVPPYASNGLALLSNYRGIAAASGSNVVLNDAMYFICTFLLGLIMIAVTILFCKFVLRPDVSKLKDLKVADLNRNPLPPMNTLQKVLSIAFCVYVLAMLLPSWLPNAPGMAFLSANSLGLCLIFVAVLAAVHISGEPVIKIGKVITTQVSWPTYFLVTAAILIGSVLTSENTGISAFLNVILTPMFSGMNTVIFIIVLMILLMVLTNLCNSLVIGMILQPVILSFCTTNGVNAAPIVTLSIFLVLSCAIVTPAASPFAAMLFGNKERLDSKDIYKYGSILVLVELVGILVIGIPLTNIFMG